MADKTGIIYASVDGQTAKICARLGKILAENKESVEVFPIENFSKSIHDFDKVVIASSIRYGKHNEKIVNFIRGHCKELGGKKNAFVSVNLVARKSDKNTPETNPYVKKFLKSIDWVPNKTGVFAGKLDYQKYSLSDKILIQLIMLITKGPVISKEAIEYTDWSKVDEFGKVLSEM